MVNYVFVHGTLPTVSPAYGHVKSALVKCNMKENPGTSILVKKGEHGQEVPCDPGQVTTILGRTCPPLLPPPTRALRTEHPPTPFQRAHPSPSTSTLLQDLTQDSATLTGWRRTKRSGEGKMIALYGPGISLLR